jgi:hypothetical protein
MTFVGDYAMAEKMDSIRGCVTNVDRQTLEEAQNRLTFDKEVKKGNGSKEFIPVDIVGILTGSMSNGYDVEVKGHRGKDGIFRPDRAFNGIRTGGSEKSGEFECKLRLLKIDTAGYDSWKAEGELVH